MNKLYVKKALVFGAILAFIGASAITPSAEINYQKSSFVGTGIRGFLYVGGDGPGNYTNIQDAIDDATEGDTIYVFNGTYNEYLILNKSGINLMGENKETTIIDAGGFGSAIDIPAFSDNNYISGFTLKNTTFATIYIHSDSTHSEGTCNYNSISDCVIRDCIGLPFQAGIRFYGYKLNCHTDYNTVTDCIIYNTSIGITFEATDGTAYVTNNSVVDCQIYHNDIGINFFGEGKIQDNIIENCNIFNNSDYGIYSEGINYENRIYHSNLNDNNQNAFDDLTNNFWYEPALEEGNYFDDYTGDDDDGDGIGDTPYDIPGGDNQDFFPLMNLFGENPPIANFEYEADYLTVQFNGSSSFDRDGEIVNYEWDFGDGNNGSGMTIGHTYDENGEYDVSLTVTDNDDFEGSITKTIQVAGPNQPPEAPSIIGNTKGKAGKEYEYTFNAIDPEDDDVRYFIDWGDNITEWTDYNESGEDVVVSHIWSERDTYIITAKAQDIHGAEGPTETLEVTMPKNKLFNIQLKLLDWLFEHFPNVFPMLRYVIGL